LTLWCSGRFVMLRLRSVSTYTIFSVKTVRKKHAMRPNAAVRDPERLQAAGRATALTVIDSQRAYAASERTLAQLETAIAEDQIGVFLALGGGWGKETASGASGSAIANR